jgi:hypothetical protein
MVSMNPPGYVRGPPWAGLQLRRSRFSGPQDKIASSSFRRFPHFFDFGQGSAIDKVLYGDHHERVLLAPDHFTQVHGFGAVYLDQHACIESQAQFAADGSQRQAAWAWFAIRAVCASPSRQTPNRDEFSWLQHPPDYTRSNSLCAVADDLQNRHV